MKPDLVAPGEKIISCHAHPEQGYEYREASGTSAAAPHGSGSRKRVSSFQSAQWQKPALVVWGSEDHVDSVAAGRRTAALLHARFVEIPGAGHLSMLAAPAAVAHAIQPRAG